MTGGRWRRIVLGHVLAEQVVVVEEVVRVSGRRGSGSFGSDRTAGYAIGEERTSPWLEAIAGIRERSYPRLGSNVPAPRTHPEVIGAVFGTDFHRQCPRLRPHRVVQRLLLCRRGARGGSSSSATAASPPAVRVGRPLALLARRCAAIAAGHTRTLLHTTACTQPCVGWNIHSPKLEQSTTRRWAIVSNGCSTTPMRETSGRLITWWP